MNIIIKTNNAIEPHAIFEEIAVAVLQSQKYGEVYYITTCYFITLCCLRVTIVYVWPKFLF